MFKTNKPIKVIHLQKLANQSMLKVIWKCKRTAKLLMFGSDPFEFGLNLLQKCSIGKGFGK